MKGLRWGLCGLLAVFSLLYIGRGLYFQVLSSEPPGDFRMRWVEIQYFLAGRNPSDALLANPMMGSFHRPLWTARDESPLPEYGYPVGGAYPPWAYTMGLPLYWPHSITFARWWVAGANVVALGVIFAFGYLQLKGAGRVEALTAGFAGTAMSANSTTLGIGQYGIIIVALLIVCYWLLARRPAGAGVMLGFAAIKPTISGPFGLVFLIPFQPRAIAAVVVTIAAASGFAWWLTGASPLEMVSQMLHIGQGYMFDSYGLMNALVWLGLSYPAAEVAAAAGSLLVAALLLFGWRRAPLLVHFAITAVAARFWSYHHLYDNVVILFLLAALVELAFRTARPLFASMALLVGVTLWAPGRWNDQLAFQVLQMVVWAIGLGVLLAATPRQTDATHDTAGV